jgi:hypothetical protein
MICEKAADFIKAARRVSQPAYKAVAIFYAKLIG